MDTRVYELEDRVAKLEATLDWHVRMVEQLHQSLSYHLSEREDTAHKA